jgi:hypothetical protein
MRRKMPVWILVWAAVLALPASAQEAPRPTGSVTIVSDGLNDPNGRTPRALRELAIALDQSRRSRAMPVMGYGGVRNIGDLLQARSVDFAILNNDILAYLDIVRTLPEARKKLRMVSALYSQRIFLAGREGLPTIEHLAGKKVVVLGAETTSVITARTMFGLAGVPVIVTQAEESAPIEAEAVLFLEGDAPHFLPLLAAQGGYRLIPLALNEALGGVYRTATISPGEAPGVTDRSDVATLKLETLIAVFDWASNQPRYADSVRFIDGFFLALPALRKQFPDSIWPALDLKASVPDWRRLDYAERAAAAVVRAHPEIAKVAAPAALKIQPTVAAAAAPAARGALRLAMTSAPPLTDQKLPGGGVIGALADAVIREASGGRTVTASWSKDRQSLSAAMLEAGGPQFTTPWETPVCPPPENASPHSAALCERALLSDPLFQVPYVLFQRPDSSFDLTSEDSAAGGVLCAPAGHQLPPLGDKPRQWIAEKKFQIIRPGSLIDCLSLMERNEADAVLVNEVEGRFTLSRLGLGATVRMGETPVATRGIHIAVAKSQPGAAAMLSEINAALARLKKTGRYGEIVGRHLRELQVEARN